MKTYLWCDVTDYEIIVALAESLEEAKKLAVNEIQSQCDVRLARTLEEWDIRQILQHRDELYEEINNATPIILEPLSAAIIHHTNE